MIAAPDARRAQVIAEARRWIGTPFHHQAAVLGVGCDCAGLIRGVGGALDLIPGYPAGWGSHARYGRLPRPGRMRRTLQAFLFEIAPDEALPGDVAWMEWRRGVPMHLGILARMGDRMTLIHAVADVGRVVEHGLTREWRGRVASMWRYPGLA